MANDGSVRSDLLSGRGGLFGSIGNFLVCFQAVIFWIEHSFHFAELADLFLFSHLDNDRSVTLERGFGNGRSDLVTSGLCCDAV